MRLRSAPATTALVTVALVALTGCSGGDGSGAGETTPPTAKEQLAEAKQVLDDATSVHLELTSSGVPDDVDGVTGAKGDGTHAPAFKGTLQARIKGLSADVPVVAVDGGLWLKLPFTSSYVKTDPADYNAPDPADLFSAEHGISRLLTSTRSPQLGDEAREGKDVVQTITGTLPGKAVTNVLVVGDEDGSYDVSYGIVTDSHQLRSVTLKGPFYPGTTSTYTLHLSDYGKSVEISKP